VISTPSPRYSYFHIHWMPVTLTVISESRVSYIAISLVVAGTAMITSSRIGTTVQTISSLVLWVKLVSGTAPLEWRNLNIA
jgi:hypothetical protein